MARRNQAIDRHLGARVRFARIEKKISQTILADHLGISFQQVQKYELGKDRISASQLVAIARTLGKEMAYFFEDLHEGEGEAGHEGEADIRVGKLPRTATAHDIKIIQMLHAIDDEQVKVKLLGLMEAIVIARAPVDRPEAPNATGREFAGPLHQ